MNMLRKYILTSPFKEIDDDLDTIVKRYGIVMQFHLRRSSREFAESINDMQSGALKMPWV